MAGAACFVRIEPGFVATAADQVIDDALVLRSQAAVFPAGQNGERDATQHEPPTQLNRERLFDGVANQPQQQAA